MRLTQLPAAAVFVVFTTVGCEPEAPLAPGARLVPAAPNMSLGMPEVPFHARVQGVGANAQDPDRCAPLLTIGLESAGTSTHLGSLTGVHSHCLDPATGVFTDGRVTFTAANGDQLAGTYGPGALMPGDRPGVFTFENWTAFTGGTGRFAGATGQAWTIGSVDLALPDKPFTLQIDGALQLVR
jgi:hypothetical protein